MQLAIGTDRHGALVTSGAGLRASDINRTLAEVRIRFRDKDDDVTFAARHQIVAGGRIGVLEGYATLREALFDLGVETRGDRAAGAAVLERSGRFYGYTLKGRDLEVGFRAPLRRMHLEEDALSAVVELRANDRIERLRALVDGAWTHRFRD